MKRFLTALIITTCMISGNINAQNPGAGHRPSDIPQRPQDIPAYRKAKGGPWCATYDLWIAKGQPGNNQQVIPPCGQGNCDDASVRDATPTEVKSVNIIVHVITYNDGSGGVSQATVDATINQFLV